MVRVPVQVPQGGSYRPTHLPMASSEQPGIVRQEKYIAVVEDAPQTAKGTSAGAARPSWNLMHMRWVLGGFGLVILLIGTLLTLQAFSANRAVERQLVKLQQQTSNSSGSSSLPTDTKPKDPSYVDNNAVAPQLPKIISIPKIGVRARVVQVGVDIEGRLDVPKTAYDVGWYTGSSRPGENGAMVVDGHVQGVGGGAIFTNLNKLARGDKLKVVRGDGKEFSYTVQSTETVAVQSVDMARLLVSADAARPGLNLITCGGTFDNRADTYTDRTIVYTLQD
jgi:LPXTG-site transpeptidase (sortase) family protein